MAVTLVVQIALLDVEFLAMEFMHKALERITTSHFLGGDIVTIVASVVFA
jgi:hypothetical protein